ncbi:cell division protein FtsQ/DivIB, partial [Actinoalloteichus caeruleus]
SETTRRHVPRRPGTRRNATRRPRRRLRLRSLLTPRGLAIVLLLGLTSAAVLLYTPVLPLRTVEVEGLDELTRQEVLAAAAIESDVPILRLDTSGIEARIGDIPRVAEVSVRRSWPDTAVISVTERAPEAVVRQDDGLWLVDRTGRPYARVADQPAEVPVLDVANPGVGDEPTLAGLRVLETLPPEVAREVLAVAVPTATDIRLRLSLGREARWGDTRDSERKAATLAALLTQDGEVYDVRAPELPTVS